jgi:hypothetical protein
MSSSADKAFFRGKEARQLGRPRELVDGRFSLAARTEWFRGWDAEDRFRQFTTKAQAQEARDVVGKLKQFASTL